MTGISGEISESNSLIGTQTDDDVGSDGITELATGNFVVNSSNWNNAAELEAGAVTFANGTTGVSGIVSAANSLVGSQQYDYVGSAGVTPLSNGNYVVRSTSWSDGSTEDVGAATFGDGLAGVSGEVNVNNSLIGTQQFDSVGAGIVALSNGNYVVRSPAWDRGSIADAGAVTFANGFTGIVGLVSANNSLVGTSPSDFVGRVVALPNGNYVISSRDWDNGAAIDAGAVTLASGTTGIVGEISEHNSLVGTHTNDRVGDSEGDIRVLSNGNYVVRSRDWNGGFGAVTLGNGVTGVTGPVSSSNSLVGGATTHSVGVGFVALASGGYVVASQEWDNGAVDDVGAVTFSSGWTGVTGVVDGTNSLIGSSIDDEVGSVMPLSNGNYLVVSDQWDNGALTDAGAVTLGDGASRYQWCS